MKRLSVFLVLLVRYAGALVVRQTSSSNTHSGSVKTSSSVDRRQWVSQVFAATAALATTTTVTTQPSWALVKGNAPPPKMKPMSDKPKCTNVEECQAQAEKLESQRAAEAAATAVDTKFTSNLGIRYKDEVEGTGTEAKTGEDVEICFKVLKLGKRSFDGLSGEGTVVFSRGYGLEDDETVPGEKTFITTLGSLGNIVALNDAVPGMREGGVRRFAILPDQGWRKAGKQCDGGPGGSGAGGDLKTDYVIVPTATVVASEACFDSSKQPFPTTYAERRRMAQRFDQSLIMEVQLVKAGIPSALGF